MVNHLAVILVMIWMILVPYKYINIYYIMYKFISVDKIFSYMDEIESKKVSLVARRDGNFLFLYQLYNNPVCL